MTVLGSGNYGEYAERKLLNGNAVELLARSDAMESVRIVMEPGRSLGAPATHAGQEFKLVIEGTVEFDIGGEKRVLGAGGWLLHDCSVPHSAANRTSRRAVYVSVVVPPGCMAVK